MSLDGWLTLIIIGAVVIVMAREIMPPTAAVLSGTIALMLTGVITSQQAFSGFSNSAPLTIAALYIVAAAVTRTGLLRAPLTRAVANTTTDRSALLRLLPGVATGSAFLNNTPIVAMLVPEVSAWAIRTGRSPSRYLMPISFAAIAGGLITLIGTSTNLVISGLLEESTGQGLGFFEITPIGLPVAAVTVGLMILLSERLLREQRSPQEDLEESFRQFILEMSVVTDGPLDGASVEDGGLRHLKGVYLAELERPNGEVRVVESGTRLAGGDRLRFVGKVNEVVDLLSMPGLESAHAEQLSGFDLVRSDFFEAVIGPSSSLVGSTLKEVGFRSAYDGAVVAIHRAGQRIDAKLGEVRLRTADTLVILADSGFIERHRDRSDFLLVAPLGSPTVTDPKHRRTVMVVAFAVLILAGSGLIPILNAALIGALALVGLGVLTVTQARDAVDLNVIVLVAASFGLAAGMENSGLAATLADFVVDGLGPMGTVGILAGIILITTLLTELISNAAAASVVFPIALVAADSLGMDTHAMAIAVAIGASTSFLTPIGYQTNMMVFGPGGYRYSDYARLGAPLTLAMVVVSVTLIQWLML